MRVFAQIRRGDGRFWSSVKRLARAVLGFHIPVASWNRPLFAALYLFHVTARESFRWLLRFFWYEPLFRSQCHSVGRDLHMEALPFILGSGRIVVGDGVRLSGKLSVAFSARCVDNPELIIGDHSFIGHDGQINISKSVRIGRHTLIAGGVRIADADGHPLDAEQRRNHRPSPPESVRPVVIGDDVWIGSRAVILKGVHIGDRSIIGAGAVVNRDVPPDVVVAGNPARVVKRLISSDSAENLQEAAT